MVDEFGRDGEWSLRCSFCVFVERRNARRETETLEKTPNLEPSHEAFRLVLHLRRHLALEPGLRTVLQAKRSNIARVTQVFTHVPDLIEGIW
jgi:hypothetical protein